MTTLADKVNSLTTAVAGLSVQISALPAAQTPDMTAALAPVEASLAAILAQLNETPAAPAE